MRLLRLTAAESDVLTFCIGVQMLNSDRLKNSPLFNALNHSPRKIEQALIKLKKKHYIIEITDEDKNERVILHPSFEHWLVKRFFGERN